MAKFTSKLRRRQLDEYLSKYRELGSPPNGFISEIRHALEMSSYVLAERMEVSQPAVIKLEESEKNGTITLSSLKKAASALGCKVVYGLIPDTSLEETIYEQARRRAEMLSESIFKTMGLEKQTASSADKESIIEEITNELLSKSKRELWKHEH
ncbi:MAG: mobile mystery protein A [Candidatus Melainabacteria bacterium]|nr:mobile mystery protein A [Candidatus Melainabacteria bacterium]